MPGSVSALQYLAAPWGIPALYCVALPHSLCRPVCWGPNSHMHPHPSPQAAKVVQLVEGVREGRGPCFRWPRVLAGRAPNSRAAVVAAGLPMLAPPGKKGLAAAAGGAASALPAGAAVASADRFQELLQQHFELGGGAEAAVSRPCGRRCTHAPVRFLKRAFPPESCGGGALVQRRCIALCHRRRPAPRSAACMGHVGRGHSAWASHATARQLPMCLPFPHPAVAAAQREELLHTLPALDRVMGAAAQAWREHTARKSQAGDEDPTSHSTSSSPKVCGRVNSF